MDQYKETLFKAFMWLQCLETLLRDCINLNCSIDPYRETKLLGPIKTWRSNNINGGWGLRGLAIEARDYPHGVNQELAQKLVKLGGYRNKLGHERFNLYMTHTVLNDFEGDNNCQTRIQREIKSHEIIARFSGAYMGPLLELHTKLSEEYEELVLKPLDENFSHS